jgi:hypothetical protein
MSHGITRDPETGRFQSADDGSHLYDDVELLSFQKSVRIESTDTTNAGDGYPNQVSYEGVEIADFSDFLDSLDERGRILDVEARMVCLANSVRADDTEVTATVEGLASALLSMDNSKDPLDTLPVNADYSDVDDQQGNIIVREIPETETDDRDLLARPLSGAFASSAQDETNGAGTGGHPATDRATGPPPVSRAIVDVTDELYVHGALEYTTSTATTGAINQIIQGQIALGVVDED